MADATLDRKKLRFAERRMSEPATLELVHLEMVVNAERGVGIDIVPEDLGLELRR